MSEEGSSHLTDDGWAETQNCRSETSDSSQVFHEHVKHQASEDARVDIVISQDDRNFPQYDLMSVVDVGFEGVDSVDVEVDGTAEVDEQIVGTADSMQ